jgi:glutamate racemase
MTNNENSIGLFDSGIGGTSIWKAINLLMPNENYIYLADSKNAPYGQKSKDEIIYLSEKNTEVLLNFNVKIVVVACNTATTNAIKELRAKYKIPFIGIEPAIKPAALHSTTHKIGILATKGTLNSALFNQSLSSYTSIEIIEQIGTGLVELIEDGAINSLEMNQLLHSYLTPMIDAGIDYLVLGCSHFPYLIPQIKKILPQHIKIIDSGEAVAKQTQYILKEKIELNENENGGKSIFYTNSNPKVLKEIVGNNYTVLEKEF